jgi:hypothetical protein
MNLAQGMSMRRAGVCLKGAFLFLAIFSLAAGHTFGKYDGGTGEPNDPYRIRTADDLLAFAADANDYGKNFILAADINLDPSLPGRRTFTTAVIASDANNSNYSFDGVAFAGVFNGAGHKIIKLTINGIGNNYLGLFGYVGGEIKNLGLENVSVNGGWCGECGCNSNEVGGLAGENHGTISNCYSTGDVNGGINAWEVGGLVGYNSGGSISNCFSTGAVIGGDSSYEVGGLVGLNYSSISNCYSTATVNSGDYSEWLGGLAGENDYGSISNCYSTGTVTGGAGGDYGGYIGGLIGGNYWGGSITNCYATGAVSGGDDANWLGGLVGDNWGIISNCFSTGVVTGGNGSQYLGGLVGWAGWDDISNCYFLDVAGPNNGYGTPLTDEQMKQQASFAGWDFVGETANGTEDIWRMCVDEVNYPLLWWQFNKADFTCPDGVDLADFAVLAEAWLSNPMDLNWNGRCEIAQPPDNIINFLDLAFLDNIWIQGSSIPVDTYDYIKLSVDSATHDTYGLAYPLTYQFSIPLGISNLRAYERYAEGDEWTAIPEKTADDFFNGVEAVRFDYVNNKVYVSVAFGDTNDEIHLKVTNTLDQTVDVNYEGIPDYYDNRSAAVVATGDDWDGYSFNDTGFQSACDAFASRKIWFTPGITTQGQAKVNASPHWSWPPVIWSHVQAKIDAGYVEAAAHSRIHPGGCTGHPYKYRGTHTGPGNSSVLTDSNANNHYGFPTADRAYLLGATITNDTDGSSGVITFNDGSNIICDEGLSGGTDNDWDYGDTYTIDNYALEIGGSKNEIIENLDLPYKKGTKKYLYAWIEPCGYWDANITVELGKWKYLADRSTDKNDVFATWDSAKGVFKRAGGSIWLDDVNLVGANSKFDSVVSARGIYTIMVHPRVFTWAPGTWVAQHLDYIKERKNIWYAGHGHLYLYHYADSQNKVTVTKIVGQ